MDGVKAADAKKNACMMKNAPGLQKDMKKRGDALKKAVGAILASSAPPTEKKAKLKTLIEKHSDGNKQYTEVLLSKCMGDVAATLREMSKLAHAVCKMDKSNKLCKNRKAVTAAQKKAESDKLKANEMRALEKKLMGL